MDQIERIRAKEIADQIMAAYDAYHGAMVDKHAMGEALRVAQMDLEATQDQALLGPHIDGKNAEIRAAQLRALTEDRVVALRIAERNYKQTQMEVELRHELLRTLRAIGSITSGTSHV